MREARFARANPAAALPFTPPSAPITPTPPDARYLMGQQLPTPPTPPPFPLDLSGIPNAIGGAVAGSLDFINRPHAAVLSGAQAAIQGQDVGAGIMQGLSGQGTKSFEELAQNIGVPEGPYIGPASLRSIASLPLDIATDPLSYVPVAGWLGKGAKLTETALIKMNRPTVAANLEALRSPGKIASFMRDRIPDTGPIHNFAAAISPRLVEENPIAQIGLAGVAAFAQVDNEIAAKLEPLIARGKALNIGEKMPLADGTERPFGDIIENRIKEGDGSAPLTTLLAPDVKAWVEDFRALNDSTYMDLIETVRRVRDNIDPARHDIVKKYDTHFGTLFEGIDSSTGMPKAYWPRLYKDKYGQVFEAKVAGTKQTLEFERLPWTEETAISRGFTPLDRMEQVEAHYRQMERQRVEAEIFESLSKEADARDFTTFAMFKNGIDDLTEQLKTSGISTAEKKRIRAWRRDLQAGIRADRDKVIPMIDNPEGAQSKLLDFARGMYFEDESVKKLDGYVKQMYPQITTSSPIADAIADLTNKSRTAMFGFDMGTALIQLLPVLSRNPKAWVQAWQEGAKALHNPNTFAGFLSDPKHMDTVRRNPDLFMERVRPGANSSEWYEGTLANIPHVIPGSEFANSAINGTIEKFGAAFSTSGNVARILMAEALMPMAERQGAQGMRDMAQVINHMTGVTSLKELGLPEAQRWLEGNILLFAPRYTRAVFSLVGDMAQKGYAGQEARQTLANMAVSGLWFYDHMARAAGQEPIYDPQDSRFLSLKVGDARVGFGSTYYSLIKLLGRTLLDPSKAITDLDTTNPLLRFWRSRMPLTTSTVMDVLTGEDFMFNATTSSPYDLMRLAMSKFAPVAIQGMVFEPGTVNNKAARTAAEFFGVRTLPETSLDIKNDLARKYGANSFDELSGENKLKVNAEAQSSKDALPTGPHFEKQRLASTEWDKYKNGVEILAQQVQSGEITGKDFRQGVHALASDRADILDVLLGDKVTTPKDPRDVTRNEYLSFFDKKDRFGRTDFVSAEQYYNNLPDDMKAYIDEMYLNHAEMLGPVAKPLVKQLREDTSTLKGYWKVFDSVLKDNGLYDWWVDPETTPAEKDNMLYSAKGKSISRMVGKKRDLMRRMQPEVDAALVRWGHVSVPINARR